MKSFTENKLTTPLLSKNDENDDNASPPEIQHSTSSDLSNLEGSCSSDTRMRPNIRGTRDKSNKDASSILAKVAILLASGTILGVCMPKDEDLPNDYYRYISSIIGYTYFLCWSVSFYPQIILNHRRKSTVGLSTDFTILNVVGFLCYSIYNAFLFWNNTAKEQYQQRYGGPSTVRSNDVAFAFHALLLSSITMAQVLHFRASNSSNAKSSRETSSDTGVLALFSPMTGYFLAAALFVTVTFAVLVYVHAYNLEFLDYLYLLSSIKLAITTIKYIPQVLMNYNRKSTEGWNVWNVLLDFSGGMLSLLQLVFDCGDMDDWTGITGNWAKFGLSFVSIVFDIVFMLQHYVLYPNHRVNSDVFTPNTNMDRQAKVLLV